LNIRFGHIERAIWEEDFLCLKICHTMKEIAYPSGKGWISRNIHRNLNEECYLQIIHFTI